MSTDPRPEFDKSFWEEHWRPDGGSSSMATSPPHPYLERELAGLRPGTALDAGCGAGAEAMWLAHHGWRVTAADISAEALAQARARATAAGVDGIEWVEADLETWEPATAYNLVTTHYAHPSGSQLDFYERLAGWVASGGTLLVVGHLEDGTGHGHSHGQGHGHGHGHAPPSGARVTADSVVARLDGWDVVTAEEATRAFGKGELHDVVVRATRPAGRVSDPVHRGTHGA